VAAFALALYNCIERQIQVPKQEIEDLILRERFNVFTIDIGEGYGPANGVFPLASFFNHSCDANCVFEFDQNLNLFVLADRYIQPGEELNLFVLDASILPLSRPQPML